MQLPAQKRAQCSWHSVQPVIGKIIKNWINVNRQRLSPEGLCFFAFLGYIEVFKVTPCTLLDGQKQSKDWWKCTRQNQIPTTILVEQKTNILAVFCTSLLERKIQKALAKTKNRVFCHRKHDFVIRFYCFVSLFPDNCQSGGSADTALLATPLLVFVRLL